MLTGERVAASRLRVLIFPLAARCSLLAIFVACSTPPAATAPTNVPSTVIGALCARMHGEGIGGEVTVVRTTEPLITRESMIALANAAYYHGKEDPGRFAEAIAAQLPKMPIIVSSEGCELRAIDTATEARGDAMLLQISGPFLNPFVHGSAGVFARVSLGNEAAQWYWVPVSLRNGAWYAGLPLPINVRV